MTKDEFQQLLEQNNAVLFGQLSQHVEATVRAEVEPLLEKMERLQSTMDGVAQRLTTDVAERAAIVVEQQRHQDWIGQLAKSTGAKLVPEQ